jgi:hypothetical protein
MDDLISADLRGNIPQLGEVSEQGDPMVWVRLSVPAAGWTGYVMEMSRPVASLWRDDDIVFFGWVIFWDEELKHFTLSDLEILPGIVTRDESFVPCRLSEVQAQERGLKPKFPFGQIVFTPGALAALQATGQGPLQFLKRHVQGDWGELDREDRKENEFSLVNGFRLLSRYTLTDETVIWIITEADRSVTTILLPEEY